MPRLIPVRLWGGIVLQFLALIAAAPPASADGDPAAPAGNPAGIWQRNRLTGDWGGLRSGLADRGISLDLTETDEVIGNLTGGIRRAAVVEGKTEIDLGLDLQKLLGWQGARFVASAYQIHGHGLTPDIGSLFTITNAEAPRGTLLADLYLEQSLLADALNIRIGQFGADEEFATSDTAAHFMNSTFGTPGIQALDLPGGGPSYPYSTPGLRVRYAPTASLSLQLGVFNGNPLGSTGDPAGTAFPIDGVLVMQEIDYRDEPAKGERGLGGTYKLGLWYDSLSRPDLRLDTSGLSLADPLSTGIPASHAGDFGIYGIVDHMLWRRPGTKDGGLSGFLRLEGAPQQNRNPIFVYLDTGVTWKGTFPGRSDDVAGIAFAWGNLSPDLAALDRDAIAFTGMPRPIRSAEMVVELTYQAAVTPWLIVQPDFQYIINPGGNAPLPTRPSVTIGGAAILGLRSVIKF